MSSDLDNFWQNHARGKLQHDSDYLLVKKLVVFLSFEDLLDFDKSNKLLSIITDDALLCCKQGF